MGLSPRILINKSTSVVPVYNNSFTSKVGQLELREAYAQHGYEGDIISIGFLGPNGNFIDGYIREQSNGAMSSCVAYPYGTVTIANKQYYTFKMRRTQNVYTAANTYWGRVASNCRVACLDDTAGQNNLWYKLIHYVESTSGEWVAVNGDGCNYGFVDTGLRTGSSPTSIAMYGSW